MLNTILLILWLTQLVCGICGYILACRAEKRAENAIRQAKLAAKHSQELRDRLGDTYDERNGNRDD